MSHTNLQVVSRDKLMDLGLLMIRCILGVVFVFHGSQKLFAWFGGGGIAGMVAFLESLKVPYPTLNAYLAGGAEFFGGLALLTGLGMRLMTIPLAITMLVACFTAHAGKFSAQHGGMEYPLTLGVVAAALGLMGTGRITLARLLWSQHRGL